MLFLFAQQIATYQTWSPDWWLQKVEQYGVSGCIATLVIAVCTLFVWMLYKYLPRIVEAFVNYMNVTATSNQEVAVTQTKLVDIATKQDEGMRQIAANQTVAAATHLAATERDEAVISHACNLVDLVISRVAPDLISEVKQHTDALRDISHRPTRYQH